MAKLKHIKDKKIILLILISSILMGTIIGCVLANSISNNSFSEITSHLNSFLENSSANTKNIPKTNFANEFIKHFKFILAIWLLAFTPIGVIFTVAILFFKGVCYGFSISTLLRAYGTKQLVNTFFIAMSQNFITFPALIIIGFCSIVFGIFLSSNKYFLQDNLKTYSIILGLGVVSSLALSFFPV